MDRIVRGRILHFLSSAPIQYEYFEDGVLVIEEGKVARLEAAETLAAKGLDLSKADHYPDQLIMPGFVDSHVHAPQLDVMGSFGKQLLDWLNDYTFPLEAKFGDRDYAADGVSDSSTVCSQRHHHSHGVRH